MRQKMMFSLMLIFSFYSLSGQTSQGSAGLQIIDSLSNRLRGIQLGADVPDVLLKKIVEVDGSVHSAKLSDYKDRLVILDFMYTTCSSCVFGLVKKQHLQEQFGNKLKFFVVVGEGELSPGMLDRENEAFIKKYLTSKNYLSFHQVKIPWVVENKALNDFFPHVNVSHLVWIYKGKLIALTEQDYVTAKNIQQVLDGKPNNWPIKNDFLPAIDVTTPLVQQAHRMNRLIAKHTDGALFGTYQDGVYSKQGTFRDSVRHTRRDYYINRPLINLYQFLQYKATGQVPAIFPSQVLLQVKDPGSYITQPYSEAYDYETRQKTLVSFEVTAPDTGQTEREHARYLIRKLDSLSGLKSSFEKRKLKCLVLYRTDSSTKFTSKLKEPTTFSRSTYRPPNINLEGDYLRNIVYDMNQYHGNPMIIDESGYPEPVDMKFSIKSWTDIPSIRKAFQGYGLDFKTEEREVNVLVLKENSKSRF